MSRPPKTSGRPDSEHGQPAPGAAGVAEHDLPADLFADATAAVHTELLGVEPADEGDGADEGEVHRPLTDARLRSVLESVLFAADRPLSPQRIHELLEETASPPGRSERSGPPLYQPARITAALDALAADYQAAGRGIELHNVAGGYQFRTAPQNAPWVQRLLQAKPVRLSRAQLETLSIVAYRQPITRPEIDDIRGVDSGGSLKTLLERQMVRVLGKKEEPGRPLLYGTTREFLEFFNLRDLKDLPTLREYYDLTDESKAKVRSELGDEALQMPLGTAGPPAAAPAAPGAPGTPPAAPAAPATAAPPTGEAPPAPGAPAAEVPAGAPPPTRELIDRQLADDAEQLAKIDELIRAVNTDFALMDLGAPQPGGVPGMPGGSGVAAGAARPPAAAPVRSEDDDEPEDDRAELAAQSLRDEDDREPEEL